MSDQSPENIPLTDLPKESLEVDPKTIQEAVNVSVFSRKGVQDIFNKF